MVVSLIIFSIIGHECKLYLIKMKNLIVTLLATSSVDSLNPIGITQQFILQGMVKKPQHIWYFILTTAVVNIVFGYLVYYGVIRVIDLFWDFLLNENALIVFLFEILLGISVFLFSVAWIVKKNNLKNKDFCRGADNQLLDENKIKAQIKHITPLALVNIGIISTVSELTSAIPYFAFLSVLVTYKFSFGVLTLVLICYNIIYIAPFVLLYVVYLLSKKKFDDMYIFFKNKCSNILEYSVPLLLLIISFVIIFNGIENILSRV